MGCWRLWRWVKRDHKAEWKQWEDWLGHIASSVKRVDGVTTRVNQPTEGLSNRTPSLQIAWDGAKLGITGQEVSKMVLDTEPRIVLASASGARAGNMASSVSIVPYQMSPGDEKVVADRLYALLSKPPRIDAPPPPPEGPPANVSGQWEVRLDFVAVRRTIPCAGAGQRKADGHAHGEFASGDLNGSVAANTVRFQVPTGPRALVLSVYGQGRRRQDVGGRAWRVWRSEMDGGEASVSRRRWTSGITFQEGEEHSNEHDESTEVSRTRRGRGCGGNSCNCGAGGRAG